MKMCNMIMRSMGDLLSIKNQFSLLREAEEWCSFSNSETDNAQPSSDDSDITPCNLPNDQTTNAEMTKPTDQHKKLKHDQIMSTFKTSTVLLFATTKLPHPKMPPAVIVEGIPASTRIPEITKELKILFLK